MARAKKTYAWARDADELFPGRVESLSDEAKEGLEYACQLAEAAQARGAAGLARDRVYVEETAAESRDRIAADGDISPPQMYALVRRARVELFGPVGDRAIREQRRKARLRPEAPAATCEALDCDNLLPAIRRRSRRFCSPSCRHRAWLARRRG